MKNHRHFGFTGVAFAGILVLLASFVPAHRALALTAHASARASSHKCIVAGGAGDSAFVRNFNPFSNVDDFARGGIYEPLVVFTAAGGGHRYWWLATGMKWSKDTKTLMITLRKGVKWSDGKPFTSKDVVYTLTAGKTNKALDQINYAASDTNIASIKAVGQYRVDIRLLKRDSNFMFSLRNPWILPQHVWAKVSDPTKYVEVNPVGTGPFTKVLKFSGQEYTLGKNPNYWQKGKPAVSCLTRAFEASNDSALISMLHGDIDWTHNFVPDAQNTYASKDPKHFHYFYPTTTTPTGLFFDDTKYPYSLPAFRKAISMAIDRAKISKIAFYGYQPPADAVGISRLFPGWLDPKVAQAGKTLVTYNPSNAKKALLKAGFKYDSSGQLLDPHGQKVSFQMHVISGWSDWVQALQIMQQNFKDIGVDGTEKLEPDWGAWYPIASKTTEPHLMWTYGTDPTPYGYFNAYLGKQAFVPSGQDASALGQWSHFFDPKATPVLHNYARTVKKTEQKKLVTSLEAMFIKDFPFIPVTIGALWSTNSTRYITGWPDAKHNYANPIYNAFPDNVVVLTSVKPVK
jgi:peptide/nickel transport system substrate-binding protein